MLANSPAHLTPLARTGPLAVLVVDDEATIRGPVGLCLETFGHKVIEAISAEDAIERAAERQFDVVLLDIRLGTTNGLDVMTRLLAAQPRIKVIVMTAYASVDVALRAMARGATDFLCKPFTPDQLAAAMARAADLARLESTVGLFPDRHGTAGAEADFATTSARLQEAVLLARRAAPSTTPITIAGESGTGKRVLARAIHGWSERPEGPFFEIDCAARSAAYVDLALFGDSIIERQPVTGEDPSLVARCNNGTLLIAHVEALSSRTQVRLARLLSSGEFDTPHGEKPQRSDVRVIATTDGTVPLEDPLRTSLDRIGLALPPLRERMDDIPALAQRYLAYARQIGDKAIFGFSVDALGILSSYHWPGNLRELHVVVDQAVRSADTAYVEARHLPEFLCEAAKGKRQHPRAGESISLEELEIAHIREILGKTNSLQEAADVLGLDLQALYRRRKQYGLE